jgi:hypothetical protein
MWMGDLFDLANAVVAYKYIWGLTYFMGAALKKPIYTPPDWDIGSL